MLRQSLVGVTVLMLGFAREPGCGDDVDSRQGRKNAPCTRGSDCSEHLICREGVCVAPDEEPSDGGEGDGAVHVDADATMIRP